MFDGLIQPWHLIIVLVIVLIIFGPGKMAGIGGALGKTIKDFRSSINDDAAPHAGQTTETVIKTTPITDNKTTTVVTGDMGATTTTTPSRN